MSLVPRVESATPTGPAATAPLPPGPPLPRWVQSGCLMLGWPSFLRACRRRHGPVFTVRVAALGTVVYVCEPAHVKAVFAGDAETFRAGEANGTVLRGVLGDSSVLVLDGAEHRERRRQLLPPFHREAVRRQAEVMAEIAADHVDRWPVDREFPLAPEMASITLEVILRTVLGSTDPERLAALRAALPPVVEMGPWAMLGMIHPPLLERRPWRAVRARLAEADRLVHAEIAARRADPGLADRHDVLSMLLRPADTARPLTDSELRDQMMTLLFAGHETTATGLAWAFERLTRHPELLRRAGAAARDGDDDYLDAVVRETLRVRPVVFDVGRTLSRPVELAGHRLPAGTMVSVGVGLAHLDPRRYPDPDRFDPDRMLASAGGPDDAGAPNLGPTSWMPFGGGGRRCLGATFAQVEMRVVLREVLRRTRLADTDAPGERQRVRHVTLVPHRGARIRVTAREPR